jgi:hypoxanthine phosphoribosyltransferase
MVAQLGIYIDHTQMLKDTIDFTKIVRTVIPEIDIVVAIPRGGNFASSIISDILGIPSSTPDRLIEKECYWTSSQKVENNREYISQKYTVPFDPTNAKILLVDDISYNSLGTLERVKRLILSKFPNAIVYKTAIYCMERTKKSLDFYCKKISMDHWMEKDILIRRRTQKIGFDMDGVLCEDCSYENVIDEEKYTKFLREAKPYLIPHYKVD